MIIVSYLHIPILDKIYFAKQLYLQTTVNRCSIIMVIHRQRSLGNEECDPTLLARATGSTLPPCMCEMVCGVPMCVTVCISVWLCV